MRFVTLLLALLLSLPVMAQTPEDAAANRLFVEAVEAWRRAEGLAGEDLSRIQERLRALRIVDGNLRRIVEQHKSSSLAVKLVVGDRIGPLGLADTRKAIEAAQQQEKEALLKALEEAADRNVRAHGGAPSPRPPATASPAPAPSPPSTAARSAPTPTPAPVAPAAQPSAAEVSFWESVRNSRDPVELEAYLTAFPQGTFAPLARTRLRNLQPAQQVAPAQQPTASQPSQQPPAQPQPRIQPLTERARQQQAATTPPAPRPLTPGSPEAQYELAYGLMLQAQRGQSDFGPAEEAMKAFVTQHPSHRLAGNAQYWYGETLYARRDWQAAVFAFGEGLKRYPSADRAPENLLRLGMALSQLNRKWDACGALAEVGRRYPGASQLVKDSASRERRRIGC